MLRPVYYDDFRCAGSRCSFTCCKGWDIVLDSEACERKLGKNYVVKPEDEKGCPLQDENGLCSIVKEEGDMAIPETCITFPRVIYEEESWLEGSLSFACVEVIDLLWKKLAAGEENLDNFLSDKEDVVQDSPAMQLRDSIMKKCMDPDKTVEDSLYQCYCYVHELWENTLVDGSDGSQEALLMEIEKMSSRRRFSEMRNLFLDVTENYKKLKTYGPLLLDIANYAESRTNRKLYEDFEEFEGELHKKYGKLLHIIAISKIFEACYNDDVCDSLTGLEIIISEFVMFRFAVFLKWEMSGKKNILYEDVRNYMMIFSRIIGNNIDSYLGFIEDGFGNIIWDLEYVKNIL